MAITVADLIAKLSLDSSSFDRGLQDAQRSSGTFVSGLGQVGLAVAAVGTAAVGGGALLLKMGSDMQDALAPVGTLVGTGTQAFADMSAVIKDIMSNSPRNANEIGLAAYETLGSGVAKTADELKGVMDWTQKLADAGLGSLADSTDLVTSAMNAFAGENLNAQDASQMLFGAISIGKGTVTSLAQGFGQIAPLAASAGVTFKDLMSATATLTTTGMEASTAYSSLKGIMTNVLKPTQQATDLAAQLGISFDGATLAAKGLPAFLNDIAVATGGDSTMMATLFGDVNALSGAMALTGPLAGAFADTLDNITTTGASLSDRATEIQQNWSYQFGVMKNKAIVFISDIGLKLIAWLQPILMDFKDWIVQNWPKIQDVFIQVKDGIINAWQAVKPILDDVIGGGIKLFNDLKDAFNSLSPVAQKVLTGIAVGLLAIAVAWNLGPGIIVTAVVALVAAFLYAYNNFDWFRNAIQAAIAALAGVIQRFVDYWITIWPLISDTIDQVVQLALFIWNNFGSQLMAVFSAVWNVIVVTLQTAVTIIQNIFQLFMNIITGNWGAAWGNIAAIFGAVWDGMVASFQLALAFLQLAWRAFELAFTALFSGLWNALLTLATTIWNAINTVITGIWTGLQTAAQTAWDTINTIISGIWNTLQALASTAWGAINTVITGIWTGLQTAAQTAWDAISTIISGVWTGITTVVTTQITGIQTIISGAWSAISAVASFAWGVITGVITGAWTAIQTGIQTAIGIVTGIITGAWNGISTATAWVWGAIQSIILTAIGAVNFGIGLVIGVISTTISGVWNTISSITTTTWDTIRSTILTALGILAFVGTLIMNNISSAWTSVWNGIKGAIDAVANAIQYVIDKAKDAVGWLGKIPGISSVVSLFSADGRIVDKPTLTWVGEAGKEVIIPLTRPARAMELAHKSGLLDMIGQNATKTDGGGFGNSFKRIEPMKVPTLVGAGSDFGRSSISSSVNNYEINVNIAPGGDLVRSGEAMVEAIRTYERRNGTGWRN